MQYFKGDATEIKMVGCAESILDSLSDEKDAFFEGAYEAEPLGDILWDEKLAPLTNAIKKEFFRTCFQTIFETFVVGGTFESYVDIFKKIFGDQVGVNFTVPAPGKLNIDIIVAGYSNSNLITQDDFEIITQTGTFNIEVKTKNAGTFADAIVREIVGGSLALYTLVDQDDDIIGFQTLLGFKSQAEVEQMLFELVPAGIFTNITLTLG